MSIADDLRKTYDERKRIRNAYEQGYAEGMRDAVKHGHWIDATKQIGFPNWSCSICGKEGRGDYLHCCWCGAKMDEVTE